MGFILVGKLIFCGIDRWNERGNEHNTINFTIDTLCIINIYITLIYNISSYYVVYITINIYIYISWLYIGIDVYIQVCIYIYWMLYRYVHYQKIINLCRCLFLCTKMSGSFFNLNLVNPVTIEAPMICHCERIHHGFPVKWEPPNVQWLTKLQAGAKRCISWLPPWLVGYIYH